MTRWSPLVLLMLLGYLIAPVHANTIQDFDSVGTTFALTQHGVAFPPPLLIDNNLPGIERYLRLGGALFTGQLNTIGFVATEPEHFRHMTANFDFRVGARASTTGEGLGFVLLDTTVYGKSAAAPAITEEPNLPDAFGIGFDVAGTNNNHISLHFDGATLGEFDPGFDLAAGLFHHALVTLDAVPGGAEVTVVLTRNLGPAANPLFAAPTTPVSDFFVAGFTPSQSRMAFGAHTGSDTFANLDFDNIRVTVVPHPAPLALFGVGLASLAALRRRRVGRRARLTPSRW